MYSTSANKTQNSFNLQYAYDKADVIVFTQDNFEEKQASSIFKLSKNKIKKIR